MFGYVAIDKPNILIKDYQTYRSYYCGLCKAIGEQNGHAMRFTLNYDIVLLALLGHNYENTDPEFVEGRCIVHPLGKKISYVKSNSILAKIANINTILGYYKILDDVIDENKHRILKNALHSKYKKAKSRIPTFDERIKAGYERLRTLEKNKSEFIVLADCFGSMLMSTADALTDKADNNLRELLFNLGKWIYIIDAFDDIKKDKGKSFNPFLINIKEFDDKIYDELELIARPVLYQTIEAIINVYNKMDIKISEGTLSNIIYLGLKARTEFVLTRRDKQCQKIRL